MSSTAHRQDRETALSTGYKIGGKYAGDSLSRSPVLDVHDVHDEDDIEVKSMVSLPETKCSDVGIN